MKKYDFPHMYMTIYAPNLEKARKIATEFERSVYQEDKDWAKEASRLAKKYTVKITELSEKH